MQKSTRSIHKTKSKRDGSAHFIWTGRSLALGFRAVCFASLGALNVWAQDPNRPIVELASRPYLVDQATMEQSAAPSIGLALEHLQALAIECHPTLQNISALAQAARSRGLQNAAQANPQLGFNGQQLGSNGRAEQLGIEFGQEIIQREKLQLNRDIGEREFNRLLQLWHVQRMRILTDVRIAYYRAARAENQIKVVEGMVDVSSQVAKLSAGLFEQGELSKSDQLLSELEVDTAELQLENARNRQVAVWRELSSVAAQPLISIQPLATDLFSPALDMQFESALNTILQQSPEVATVLASIERSQVQVRREVIEPRPNVTVQGLVNIRDNGIQGDRDGALIVTIPIPVWNRNRGAIQEARYQLIAAQRQLSSLELELQNRLTPVFERYSNSQIQVQRYRDKILPKSLRTLELARKAFASGDVSFLNTLIAQRAYAQYQIAYLEAIETLRVAEAEIEGLLLTGSLNKAP
jgi:cobalt-zinc-cadmium efflux system outer membrane protein